MCRRSVERSCLLLRRVGWLSSALLASCSILFDYKLDRLGRQQPPAQTSRSGALLRHTDASVSVVLAVPLSPAGGEEATDLGCARGLHQRVVADHRAVRFEDLFQVHRPTLVVVRHLVPVLDEVKVAEPAEHCRVLMPMLHGPRKVVLVHGLLFGFS